MPSSFEEATTVTVPRDINRDVASGAVPQAPDDQSARGDMTVGDDLNVAGGIFSGAQQAANVTGAKTLAITDSGIIQRVTATATVTLPATVVGYYYIIENGGADGTVTINVSPNASDKIAGNGFTATDDKDAINTLGNHGDRIELLGDGVNGWFLTRVIGLWTRE